VSSVKASEPSGKFYIRCITLTLAALLTLFALYLHERSEAAPVYVLEVSGLNADTPADAQAQCRAEHEKYAEYAAGMDGVVWVWCGGNKLYLVKADALKLDIEAEHTDFTAVSFPDESGSTCRGYIIDPTAEPRELMRIHITDAEEFNFDLVSMSIRRSLRSGEISLTDAVYIWEAGSDTVFAVFEGSYTAVTDSIVSFTDDGDTAHTCFILDTKLD